MPDQDCRVIWIGSGKLKEPVMLHSEGRGVCISVWCMCCRDNSPVAACWGNRNIPLHHSSAATTTVTQIITVYMQPISKQHHPLKSSQEPICSPAVQSVGCSHVRCWKIMLSNLLSVLISKIQQQHCTFIYIYIFFPCITSSFTGKIVTHRFHRAVQQRRD